MDESKIGITTASRSFTVHQSNSNTENNYNDARKVRGSLKLQQNTRQNRTSAYQELLLNMARQEHEQRMKNLKLKEEYLRMKINIAKNKTCF